MKFRDLEVREWLIISAVVLCGYWLGFKPAYDEKIDNYSAEVWAGWKADPIIRQGFPVSVALSPLTDRIRNQLSMYEMFDSLCKRYIGALLAGVWKGITVGGIVWFFTFLLLIGSQACWMFLLDRIQEFGDAIRGNRARLVPPVQ